MATTCVTNKIDSNTTGLRYTEEECPKILPASPVWYPLEPNVYNDFGGQVTSTARAPINQSRQRLEGEPTDLDASGGINQDMTQENLQDLLQGYMFADTRVKTDYEETGASGDLAIAVASGFPTMTSTTLDFTTLGLVPGEWIYIGGDAANETFATPANNGFKRVRSIAANVLTFDKSVQPMVADAGTGKTIKLFFGKVLKNEADPALIKRRTYQLERTLGSLDGLQPAQSEYLVGAACNEFSMNLATADKVTVDMSFVGLDFEQRTQAEGYKPGTRPTLTASGGFINTSSDFKRIKLSTVSATDEVPTPLFSFLQEGSIVINNGITANKAIGVMGAFDTSAGDFVVNGTLTAYFSDIAAVKAVRNSARCTLDAIVVKGTTGMILDIPLVKLGDGRANVVKDDPITLPLSMDAATAAAIDPNLDYTLMWVFFQTLPARAGANP